MQNISFDAQHLWSGHVFLKMLPKRDIFIKSE